MSFQILVPTPSMIALAERDVRRFGQLLRDRGGANIFTNGQADPYIEFTRWLYSALGSRQDFLAVRASQNMGTSTRAYTLHGLEGVISSGIWTESGLEIAVDGGVVFPQSIYSGGINYSGLAVFNQIQNTTGTNRVFEIGGTEALRNGFQTWRSSMGSTTTSSPLFVAGDLAYSSLTWSSGFIAAGYCQTGGALRLMRNGATLTSAARSVGAHPGGTTASRRILRIEGVSAFCILPRVSITPATYLAVWNKYKETLGSGLTYATS